MFNIPVPFETNTLYDTLFDMRNKLTFCYRKTAILLHKT